MFLAVFIGCKDTCWSKSEFDMIMSKVFQISSAYQRIAKLLAVSFVVIRLLFLQQTKVRLWATEGGWHKKKYYNNTKLQDK